MYLEVVALLGVARRFLFRYSPTIPPPCHTHSPIFLYLGNPYSCISVFVNALNSCFPLCEAKFDRLLVHSGICPPTQNSISLQFLVHSPLSACCSSFRAWCPNSKVHNNFHTRSGRPENCLCELKPPWKLQKYPYLVFQSHKQGSRTVLVRNCELHWYSEKIF